MRLLSQFALARVVLIIFLIAGPASIFSFMQTLDQPPSNDNFDDAQQIEFGSGSQYGELFGATVEPNEPVIGKGMATVWYTWMAPADRSMTFRVVSEEGAIASVGVFRGESLGKLSLLASGNARDRLTIIASQGIEYKIQVSAKERDQLGWFYLTWNVNAAESWKQFDFDGPDNWFGEPEYGHSDFAIFRWWTVMTMGTPQWWVWSEKNKTGSVYAFGNIDVPMQYRVADYDGDEKADIAVFYPGTGLFWIFESSKMAFRVERWGISGDIAVTGDFDGDDVADVAIWRGADSTFWIKRSTDSSALVQTWGRMTDVPIPADYDGDGVTDIALVRDELNGHKTFFIWRSSDHEVTTQQFGLSTDVVLPGDFDADGKADVAVFRSLDASFHYLRSSDGTYATAALPAEYGPYYYVTPGDYFNGQASDLCAWRWHPQGILYCLPDGGVGSLVRFPFGHQADAPIVGTKVFE